MSDTESKIDDVKENNIITYAILKTFKKCYFKFSITIYYRKKFIMQFNY